MSSNVEELGIRLRADGVVEFVGATGRAAAAVQQVGTAAQAVTPRVTQLGVSAGQTAQAMRQLPMQITDVVTSLSSGMPVWMVAIQQGGQIRDSFGGIGNAARAVVGMITPMTAAVGALGGALLVMGAAAYAAWKEDIALRNAMILTNNVAGLTRTRINEMSSAIAASSQQTVGASREIIVALAETGRVGSGAVQSTALAVARLADLTGKSAADISRSFAGQLEAPTKFAAKLNESYNFLNAAQLRRIDQLEREQGAVAAANETNRLLTQQFEQQLQQLGMLEKALDSNRGLWSQFWEAAKNINRPATLRDQLDIEIARMRAIQVTGRARVAQEQRIEDLRERVRLENQLADAQARNASVNAAEVKAEAARIEQRKRTDAAFRPLPLTAIRDPQAETRANFLRSEKEAYEDLLKADRELRAEAEKDPLGDFINSRLAAADERNQRRLKAESEFLLDLEDQRERAAILEIQNEETRGLALIDLDRRIAQRRLQARVDSGEVSEGGGAVARALIDDQAVTASRAASRRVGDAVYGDVSGAFVAALRDTRNPVRAFAESLGNAVFDRVSSRLAEALATAAVGRDGTSGFLGQFLGSLYGGGGGGGAFSGTTGGVPDFDLYGRASGGPVDAGRMYLVGEQGPELLRMGRGGGEVVPTSRMPRVLAGSAGSSGGSGSVQITLSPVIHIDARTDRAEVAAMVQQGMRASQAELLQAMSRRQV